MTVKQAVVFSILMQNGGGILTKAPGYVKEKLELCASANEDYVLLQILHLSFHPLYHQYLKRWDIHLGEDGKDGKETV